MLLVLIFLSCAYLSTEAQSETIQAERLVGFHKKLQQINDFEPVKFLPVRLVLISYHLLVRILVPSSATMSDSISLIDFPRWERSFLFSVSGT